MQDIMVIQTQVIAAVKKAAQFIQNEIGTVQHSDIETKSLNSLVTYVDKKSEQLLVDELKLILPMASFLTEENTIETEAGEWQWIIDPLDGTTNFIHQIPVFAISVALYHQNEIVLGVVYEIHSNECFYASKNKGAFCNGTKISISDRNKLSDSLVATGFPYYDFGKMDSYLNILNHLMQHTRGIRRLGAASVDLCYVACGRFDAFFEYSLAPWDVAAGALIVQEAGGVVTDFFGHQNWLFGKEIVAVNNHLKDDFLTLITLHFSNSHSSIL